MGSVCLALVLTACVPTAEGVKKEGEAGVAAPVMGGQAAVGLTVEQIAYRRNLERELDRDHAAYLKRVSERNVDGALEFVPADSRAKKQDDLWRFIGEYSFESFDVAAKKVEYDGDAAEAEIKAVLVVYMKNVVSPKQYEMLTQWRRDGDKWLLKP